MYLTLSASTGHVSDPGDPDNLRDRSFPDPGVHSSAEFGGRQPAAGSLRVSRRRCVHRGHVTRGFIVFDSISFHSVHSDMMHFSHSLILTVTSRY